MTPHPAWCRRVFTKPLAWEVELFERATDLTNGELRLLAETYMADRREADIPEIVRFKVATIIRYILA